VAHEHTSAKNLLNAALCTFAIFPSIAATWYLYTRCDEHSTSVATFGDAACTYAMESPIGLANALFFANVTVGFWVIGLLQRSFWLIDPYWTIIPPLLGHLYALHPRARGYDPTRSALCLGLLWVWSARLTVSYFRREDWKFGQREDWRYSKMARDGPRSWPISSFFAVGLAQQPMLVGITLPAYSAHFVHAPLGSADVAIAVLCAAGIWTAMTADDQLRAYVLSNEARAAAGKPKLQLLETGLWRYSRHPNYFGEQLWWWAFAVFAVALGQPEMCAGTFFNSIILAVVTVMTERKMLKNWSASRAKLYREYMWRTSPCVPWFRGEVN
jgi:steroid 5-alpha reductase family enzyme